ncbi:unnamed protein product [Prorocentrum cordatum]|uniref:Carboxylic ester hydrolase n=1 Tax=Prorocentrum cordatum TaxID=2364126 RepID=A0ABN9PTQ9_9DINO|nr:unnamed protein product [Polarella glacialis]
MPHKLPLFEGHELSKVANAYARLSMRDDLLFDDIADEIIRRPQELDAAALVLAANAFGHFRISHPRLWLVLSEWLLHSCLDLEAKDVAVLLNAFGAVGFHHEALLRALVHSLGEEPLLGEVEPGSLALALNALARLQWPGEAGSAGVEEPLRRLAERAADTAGELGCIGAAQLLHACAQLRALRSDGRLLEGVLARARGVVSEMNAQSLSMVVNACAKMRTMNPLLCATALGLFHLASGLGFRPAKPSAPGSELPSVELIAGGSDADPVGPQEKEAIDRAKKQCGLPRHGQPNLENGVIVFLVTRHSDVIKFKESLPRLRYHFLRHWSYPVKVFIPSDALRKYDSRSFKKSPTNETMHDVMLEFGGMGYEWSIETFDLKFPKVISDDDHLWQHMNSCARIVSDSYKHMNQFFIKSMYEHPALAKYRYYLRIDADFDFEADLVEDPFCMMSKTGRKFMWQTRKLIAEKKCSAGLWDWFLQYQQKHDLTPHDPMFWQPWGATVNYVGYAGMGDLDFFRSEPVRRLAEALNEDGHIYYNRWSDQTYYPLLFALFENHSAVGDVGFGWPSGTWCHKCGFRGKFNPDTGRKRAKVAAAAGSQVLKRSLSCGISDALRSESTSQPASGLMHSLRAAMLSVRATLFGHHAHLKICTVVVSRPRAGRAPRRRHPAEERGLVEDCAASPIVQTADGPVQGFSHRSAQTTGVEVSSFWGIPFAQPPVGELRLRAPRPLNRTWSTPLAATKKSKACLQWEPGKFQSEDCLYLNVYTPTRSISADAGLPVMVWVHGGAYTQGDAYQSVLGTSVYDGSNIAGRHQLVVVTLQYRLNGLGFWASDQLREEDPAFSTGNMALRDQRAALQWVQRNARAFGGDPSRVTLFGESAGGFSVMWHLVSRPSWPLFQAAIMESGTDHLSWFFQPYEGHSKEFYAQWAEKIGCPASEQQLVCLRGKDALLLTRPPAGITVAPPTYDPRGIGQSMAVGPTIDGAEEGLASVPLDLVREGLFNRVPLLLGSCKARGTRRAAAERAPPLQRLEATGRRLGARGVAEDGGTIFEPILTGIVPGMDHMRIQSMDELLTALNWSFDADDVPKILSAYPQYEFVSGTRVDFSRMFTRIIRDCSFQCPVRSLASEWSKHGVPVWLYVFSFPLGIIDNLTGIGDLHGSDG